MMLCYSKFALGTNYTEHKSNRVGFSTSERAKTINSFSHGVLQIASLTINDWQILLLSSASNDMEIM